MKKQILAWILVLVLLLSGCSGGPEPETTGVPSEEGLIVHFLDVGQADCALLESGGEYLLIDGGNRADSDLVVSFLEQQGVEELAAVDGMTKSAADNLYQYLHRELTSDGNPVK